MYNKKSSLSKLLSEKQRQDAINEIISFYLTERDESIGIIAAEEILDMFLEKAGEVIYNKAIDDAKKFVEEKTVQTLVDMEIDLKK